jgi:bifunctional non-homologous end joining protein LigD
MKNTQVKSNLHEYAKKRDFKITAEPGPQVKKGKARQLSFVVQEHHASHLHYDFRLEWNGVLKSWAVPKGPSLDPGQKRLAVEVEDHPVKYGSFEGVIPAHEYGAGQVYIYDRGTWEPGEDVAKGLKKGHLDFTLKGKKLKGNWVLVRTHGYGKSNSKSNWLLIKRSDEFADAERGNVVPVGQASETSAKPPHSPLKPKPLAKKKAGAKVSKLPSARERPLSFVTPQLCLLVNSPPEGDEWIHEMKFDGYRLQTILQKGKISLLTRSGQDWTEKFESIEVALKKINVSSAIFDGELCVLDKRGHSDFQKLQEEIKAKKSVQFVYYIFDLLHLNGKDLRNLPLTQRKELLKSVLQKHNSDLILFSDDLEGEGDAFLKSACELDLEGIVSKRKDSIYSSGRGDSWVKSKCTKRQEFVIGGYTSGQGERNGFGALLLGVYENKKLKYVGRCGTGFDQKLLSEISGKLKKIEISRSPFDLKSPHGSALHFVKPKLVAEIKFSNWTKDEVLRVPVFQGLRLDKAPEEIKMERAGPVKTKAAKPSPLAKVKTNKNTRTKIEPLTVTHPDKILFRAEKITKGDVAEYYQKISKHILPHLENRPLSLMRCPDGAEGECFYQKHLPENFGNTAAGQNSPFHEIPIEESKGLKNYTSVDSEAGLVALVQMGAFEIHEWNCRSPKIENPDQFVMDFDPNPDVSFARVKEAALTVKKMLEKLGLKSFLKVTGGKGLHVHVPIAPVYTWEQIKEFSQSIAKQMTDDEPERYTATLSKKARTGKIFVDYLRNGRGATAVAPYSLRAKKTSSVAMPIEWKDLAKLKSPDQFTLPKALAHLKSRKSDPWKDILKTNQKIKILRT